MLVNDGPTARSTAAAPQPARQPSPAQRVRSTVVGWFKGDDHQTTAGEVQGQGPYPGVPGYSTLDNWTRAKATGTYTAPDYVSQLMEKAGYAQPSVAGTGRQSFPGLNMKAAEDLTPYGYKVTDEEARNILKTYAPTANGDPSKLTKEKVEAGARSAPMTLEAYNKLSDDQRAAVDFNTALVAAREKDLANGWMIRVAPDKAGYDSQQKEMFGEDATTGGYAEHTQNLLARIGYKAPGTSLTDFLSLDRAVTTEELANLDLPKDISFATKQPAQQRAAGRFTGPSKRATGNADNTYEQLRSQENLQMIELDVIRRAAEAITKARQSGNAESWSPAATAASFLGGSLRPEDTPFGYGFGRERRQGGEDEVKDNNFRTVLEVLQNDSTRTKLADSAGFWAKMKEQGYDEKDLDELFQFLDMETRRMLANKVKPYEGQNDATVIRELAGLGPINGSAS